MYKHVEKNKIAFVNLCLSQQQYKKLTTNVRTPKQTKE